MRDLVVIGSHTFLKFLMKLLFSFVMFASLLLLFNECFVECELHIGRDT